MQTGTGSEGETAVSSGGDSDQANQRLAPPRVLLIEDEPGIVDFVRRGLEAEGFVVEAALDGAEGERLALRGNFDAIVLDLMLPAVRAWTSLPRCAAPSRRCR